MERDTKNMITNTVCRIIFCTHSSVLALKDNVIRSYYGNDFPSISELGKKVIYEFANSNLILEEPRLNSQRIKFIGGIGNKKADEIKDQV